MRALSVASFRPNRAARSAVRTAFATWVAFATCYSSSLVRAQAVERNVTGTTACLRWVAQQKSGCPTTEEVAASVESVLDRQVFVAADCDIRVQGSMAPSPKGGWLARLSFADRSGRSLGTRHLEGVAKDCASMRGPTSLVIALMVEATESTVAIVESTPPAPASTTPIPPPARRTEERAYADLRAAYGLLPGISLGASMGLDATLAGVIPGRFEASLWLPKSSQPGPGGRFWAWHTGVALCPNLNNSERLRVALCGGAQLGLIHARGVNLEDAQSTHRPYGQVEARMILSIPLGGSLALSPHLAFAVPFLRPRFVYLDATDSSLEVHRPSSAVLMAGVGLIWIQPASTPDHSAIQ